MLQWDVRGAPGVKETFAALWQTEELLVNFDAVLAYRPWCDNPASQQKNRHFCNQAPDPLREESNWRFFGDVSGFSHVYGPLLGWLMVRLLGAQL